MERRYKDKKYGDVVTGLKIVHIGEDVWKAGRIGKIKTGQKHCVIYGPNRKEYHVYDKDTELLRKEYDPMFTKGVRDYDDLGENGSYVVRGGNDTIESSVKIYILTNILDKGDNWEFDLKNIPNIGNLKVMYNNGTVKNIDFNGEFESIKLNNKYYKIKPIAYRKV